MRHGLVRRRRTTRVPGLSDQHGNAHLTRGGLGRAAAFSAAGLARDTAPAMSENLDLAFGEAAATGMDIASIPNGRIGLNLFDIAEGEVTRLRVYVDGERALADLGLKEWALSQEDVEVGRKACEAWERGQPGAWLGA